MYYIKRCNAYRSLARRLEFVTSCSSVDTNRRALFSPLALFFPRQNDETETEEEEEDMRNSSPPPPCCYYEVKPLGMLFFLSEEEKAAHSETREKSLGDFSKLSDEILLNHVLSEHVDDAKTLMRFAVASKMCFEFAAIDSLWKKMYLQKYGLERADFRMCDSWKALYAAKEEEDAETNRSTNNTNKKKTPIMGEKKKVMRRLYSDALYLPKRINNIEIKQTWVERFTVPEIDCRDVDDDEDERGETSTSKSSSIERAFREEFEKNNRPVVLRGLAKNWKAIEKWKTNEALLKEYGEETFLVGGYRTCLKNYVSYCLRENDMDDNKLLLFDPKAKEEMWTENTGVFEEGSLFHNIFTRDGDYFKVLGEEKRPHYKWVIFGPNRSGSTFHVDPNGTSAWNAVIRGRKKWILFPHDEVPPGVFPSEDNANVVCPLTPLEWYENFYDACTYENDDYDGEETKARHFQETICEPGDVIFVPSQWWHCVVNLPPSEDDQNQDEDKNVHLALTANFVSRSNMPTVLKILDSKNSNLVSGYDDKAQRHSLGEAFEARMRETYPEILADARQRAIKMDDDAAAAAAKKKKKKPRRAPNERDDNGDFNEDDDDDDDDNNNKKKKKKKQKNASSSSIFAQTTSFAFGFGGGNNE